MGLRWYVLVCFDHSVRDETYCQSGYLGNRKGNVLIPETGILESLEGKWVYLLRLSGLCMEL